MAWRSVSLLDATKSPFMLVLSVAAPHQYQNWQVEDFAYMKSRESPTPSDADMPFSIAELVKTTGAERPDGIDLHRTCCVITV